MKTDPRTDGRVPSLEPPVRPVPVYDRSRKRADPLPTRALVVATGIATTLGLVVILVPPDAPVATGSTTDATQSGGDAASLPGVAEAGVTETPAPSPSPARSPKPKVTAKSKGTHKTKATPKSAAATRNAPASTARTAAATAKPRATAKPTPRPTAKPTPRPTPKPTPVPTGASGKKP